MHALDGNRNRLILSLVLLLAACFFSACDDTPIVGGDLSPNDVTVDADTIYLRDLSIVGSPSFSGNLPYVTTGAVEDPVFGKIRAISLFRPSIVRQEDERLESDAVARMSLKVGNIYGSSAEPAEFEIVEIDRPWRGSSWRYDSIPGLSDNVVGSFSITDADSVVVDLNGDWTRRYREFFMKESSSLRDSLYRKEMPGLAVVPAHDNGKLVSIEAYDARIMFSSGSEDTDLQKSMSSWAVSLDENLSELEKTGATIPLINTMTAMMELDYDLTRDLLGTSTFSRVELVIYEDEDRMDTGEINGFVRPRTETIRLFYLESQQLNYAITTEPRFQANLREEDSSYRINVTNLAKQRLQTGPDPRRLYVVPGFNDGRVFPVLFCGPDNSRRQPSLLITSISQNQ